MHRLLLLCLLPASVLFADAPICDKPLSSGPLTTSCIYVPLQQLTRMGLPGVADGQDRFQVWVNSQDASVIGYRVTVEYQQAGKTTALVQIGPAPMLLFRVPAGARVVRYTVQALRESQSLDVVD